MKYHESEEMYLETILLLTTRQNEVRSIDIANELNYSRASVSRAMGLLQKKEYIVIENSFIKLTELGMKRATDIFERHEIITDLLVKIGVSKEMAEDNACRIEHVISPELLVYFKKFLEKK